MRRPNRASPPPACFKFWGVRGSIPTPGPGTVYFGGNTSCIEVRAASQIIILDAGTGLRRLGRELVEEFDGRPIELTLLLTHTHWDHIQGLPFFLPVYKPQDRIRILGYEGARLGLDNVLTGQMESPFFPIGLREVPANVTIEELKEFEFNIGKVRIAACRACHPGNCVGYRLSTPKGSLAFFPDNELPRKSNGQLVEEVSRITHFLRGTDTLIMDSQYDRKEYGDHIGWGHGCLDEVIALALRAEVKRLFMFHHDPDHDDAKIRAMVAHARKLVASAKGTLKVEAAREGMAVDL